MTRITYTIRSLGNFSFYNFRILGTIFLNYVFICILLHFSLLLLLLLMDAAYKFPLDGAIKFYCIALYHCRVRHILNYPQLDTRMYYSCTN